MQLSMAHNAWAATVRAAAQRITNRRQTITAKTVMSLKLMRGESHYQS